MLITVSGVPPDGWDCRFAACVFAGRFLAGGWFQQSSVALSRLPVPCRGITHPIGRIYRQFKSHILFGKGLHQ